MPYIGKQPVVGNFQVCDAISVVNGQAAYTMQVASTNVSPESAFHMLVSLNGILQKPGSSFTISGSTITFASNLATGDVIDFIILLGDVLNIGAPSDDTVATASIQANAVTAAKFNADVISGQTALGAEPADTDEFLVSDAGVLKRVDYSYIKGGGKVLQVVTADHSTEETTSSTSYVNSSLTANITPSATTSKVLVLISGSQRTSGNSSEVFSTVFRDSTDLGSSATTGISISYTNGGNITTPICISVLDSPSSTSQLTYRMKFRASGSHAQYVQAHGAKSTIILMEIGA